MGTLFTDNTREIDFLFGMLRVDHEYMNQILINSCIQRLQTNRTKKVNPFSLLEVEIRMLQTCIASSFGMQQQQSFLPSRIPDPEYDMVPNPQMSPAVRAYIVIFHDNLD